MKKFLVSLSVTFLILLTSLSSFAQAKLPVLMYHNVTSDYDLVLKDPTVHITAMSLEEHLVSLISAGYNTISLDDYYAWYNENKPLPPNPILITFDDGYVSNYELAYPLFQKYNLKATIFVIASRMGADNVEFPHFSWEEAREMERSGLIDIESHSFTHPDFSRLSYAQTVVEMRLSKFAIESNLGKKCRYFAYPYGKLNSASTAVAKSAGYEMVVVGRDKSADIPIKNVFEIPRYTVKGTHSGEDVINLIRE